MSIEIKSPTFPESVADGTVANWLKKEGESVNQDDVIAEIETDKVVLEVLAQSDGVITKIIKSEGEIVSSAEVIGEFSESSDTASTPSKDKDIESKDEVKESKADKPATKNITNNISGVNVDISLSDTSVKAIVSGTPPVI